MMRFFINPCLIVWSWLIPAIIVLDIFPITNLILNWFTANYLFPFLKIGFMLSTFHIAGTEQKLTDLGRLINGVTRTSLQSFKVLGKNDFGDLAISYSVIIITDVVTTWGQAPSAADDNFFLTVSLAESYSLDVQINLNNFIDFVQEEDHGGTMVRVSWQPLKIKFGRVNKELGSSNRPLKWTYRAMSSVLKKSISFRAIFLVHPSRMVDGFQYEDWKEVITLHCNFSCPLHVQ